MGELLRLDKKGEGGAVRRFVATAGTRRDVKCTGQLRRRARIGFPPASQE